MKEGNGRPIDKIDSLPPDIKERFRGRSVPSPQARSKPGPKEELILENHIIPFNFNSNLYTEGQALILIATSDLVFDIWRMKIHIFEKDTTVNLVAKTDKGMHLFTFDKLKEGDNKSTGSWTQLNFAILEGEELYIRSDKPIDLTITLEFIRHGRKVSRTIPVLK